MRFNRKFGGDKVVVVHGEGGFGSLDIGDGVHIASPVDKAVALFSLGHQVDHCSLVIAGSPLSRGRDRTAGGTGDGEVILGCRCRGASNDVT